MKDLQIFEAGTIDRFYKATDTLAKSKIIPYHLQGKPADIFAILVMGHELGLQPMQAINSINVIQGKTTVSPQLMIGMVKSKIPDSVIKIEFDDKTMTAKCTTARNKQDIADGIFYEAIWDMDRAKKMGLSGKDNYVKQAGTMLRWRAVAESCRMTFPDVIMGLYAPEEFQNFDGKVINADLVSPQTSQEMLDADFPIPPEEKEVGDFYRVQNGKFRGKQLKDIPVDEIASYREELIGRKTHKEWETDLISVFGQYLGSLEGIQE